MRCGLAGCMAVRGDAGLGVIGAASVGFGAAAGPGV